MRALGSTEGLLVEGHLEVVWLLRIDHADGIVRVHDGVGDISFDDGFGVKTYSGLGTIGSFESIKEDLEVSEKNYRINLSGIDPQLLSLINQNALGFYNARCWIWFLILENGQPSSDPVMIYHGNTEAMDQINGSNSASITLITSQFWVNFRKANRRKLSNASHQEKFPGDRILEFSGLGRRVIAFLGQEILFEDDGRFEPKEGN